MGLGQASIEEALMANVVRTSLTNRHHMSIIVLAKLSTGAKRCLRASLLILAGNKGLLPCLKSIFVYNLGSHDIALDSSSIIR